MTTQRALLLMVVWFVAVFLVALAYLSLNQRPPLATDEVALAPACSPRPPANPCATQRCEAKPVRNMA